MATTRRRSTSGEERSDTVSVAESGPGIPKDQQGRLFERLGQSSHDDGWTGIGLAVCRRVVDARGWTVGVTASEAGGDRFEITGMELGGE